MKYLFLIAAVSITILTACNDSSNNQSNTDLDTAQAKQEAPVAAATNTATPVKDILAGYLELKNSLTRDDDKAAAAAGVAMTVAFKKFDKSILTAEQKKTYEDIEADAKEHAEHIGKNAGNLAHQREHFETLSKDLYELVKTFGAGQPLYQDFCPMYNDGKGATWLSETKEVKNPYFGKKMPTCGSIKEELK